MTDVGFDSGRLGAKLFTGASIIALAITATPAWAQSAPAPTPADATPDAAAQTGVQVATNDKDTIVVTGIRQSLRSAREIKRNSDQIVDSVTASDIGALPDRSVSEALQRIPGVTLQRTN